MECQRPRGSDPGPRRASGLGTRRHATARVQGHVRGLARPRPALVAQELYWRASECGRESDIGLGFRVSGFGFRYTRQEMPKREHIYSKETYYIYSEKDLI